MPNQVPEIRFANGKSFLIQAQTSIGRDDTNQICLEDASVSSKHALLEIKQGRVFLTDLGSTNGSFINGEQVQMQEVRHDDQITIGMVKASLHMPHSKAERTQRQQPAVVVTQKRGVGCLGWITRIIISIVAVIGGATVVFDDEIANEQQRIETQGLNPNARIMQVARASVKVVACLESKCVKQQNGSGVIIKLEGQIRVLTAYHVIENAKTIKIWYNEFDPYVVPKTPFEAITVSEDSNLDLALLRFCEVGQCPAHQGIPIGDSDAFASSSDTKIELFGFPPEEDVALSRYSQVFKGYGQDSTIQTSRAWIRTSEKVLPGNSGGAAINSVGELIGIVLKCRESAINCNIRFGLIRPSNLIKNFLWK
jgi:pSer/pThr/pTyr-binding forkhead associated (FHA) protein